MNNNWIKTLDTVIPYLDHHSLSTSLRNDWGIYRHNHAVCELHIILEGSSKFQIEEDIFQLEAGQALIIRPGVFHSNIEITKPFLRLSLSFSITDKFNVWKDDDLNISYFHFKVTPFILQTCYNIFEEHDKGTSYLGQEMLSVLISQLLISIFRTVQKNKTTDSDAVTSDFRIYQTVDAFFSIPINPYEKDFSRKKLANALHCSERQIDRLIPKLYSMTFQQKRNQARMDYAKYLLSHTDKKISEICTLVGYANAAPFNRLFKSHYGITPQKFRATMNTRKN